MKKSLEETLKEVELCKEIYRLINNAQSGQLKSLNHKQMSSDSDKIVFSL